MLCCGKSIDLVATNCVEARNSLATDSEWLSPQNQQKQHGAKLTSQRWRAAAATLRWLFRLLRNSSLLLELCDQPVLHTGAVNRANSTQFATLQNYLLRTNKNNNNNSKQCNNQQSITTATTLPNKKKQNSRLFD